VWLEVWWVALTIRGKGGIMKSAISNGYISPQKKFPRTRDLFSEYEFSWCSRLNLELTKLRGLTRT
jgi:hypothetical protein